MALRRLSSVDGAQTGPSVNHLTGTVDPDARPDVATMGAGCGRTGDVK